MVNSNKENFSNKILFEIKNIEHTFESLDGNKYTALKNISAKIEKGSFTAIIGTNGSGKSTFARHLNALLLPTSGEVFVDGMSTKDFSNVWNIRQKVGMVFQNPDNQLVAAVVDEEVAFGPENLGVSPDEIRKRVKDCLKKVGLSEYEKHAPSMLSGGQKQRLAIAGVLAMKPSCIVLDEPTAMLDPSGRKEVMSTIHELNKNEGITIVLITHFMEEAVSADKVLVMDKGSLAFSGTPREVFSKVDELRNIGLAVPVSTGISYGLYKKGLSIKKDCMSDEELGEALCPFVSKM